MMSFHNNAFVLNYCCGFLFLMSFDSYYINHMLFNKTAYSRIIVTPRFVVHSSLTSCCFPEKPHDRLFILFSSENSMIDSSMLFPSENRIMVSSMLFSLGNRIMVSFMLFSPENRIMVSSMLFSPENRILISSQNPR